MAVGLAPSSDALVENVVAVSPVAFGQFWFPVKHAATNRRCYGDEIATWFDKLGMILRRAQDERKILAMTGVLRQAQEERGWGHRDCHVVRQAWDGGGWRLSPSPQPSPIEGEGEGTGFYLDEQDERDVQDFWVRGWRDCHVARQAWDGGGWRLSPSPQPSPIEGEGEGTGFYMDEQDGECNEIATSLRSSQ